MKGGSKGGTSWSLFKSSLLLQLTLPFSQSYRSEKQPANSLWFFFGHTEVLFPGAMQPNSSVMPVDGLASGIRRACVSVCGSKSLGPWTQTWAWILVLLHSPTFAELWMACPQWPGPPRGYMQVAPGQANRFTSLYLEVHLVPGLLQGRPKILGTNPHVVNEEPGPLHPWWSVLHSLRGPSARWSPGPCTVRVINTSDLLSHFPRSCLPNLPK